MLENTEGITRELGVGWWWQVAAGGVRRVHDDIDSVIFFTHLT